jgi:DNA repair protein RadC
VAKVRRDLQEEAVPDKSNPTGIKSWPKDDRPREKLLRKGSGALSNSELLAILLRTGVEGTSAIDLARRIVEKFGTFRNMSHTDVCEWKGFKGLGPAKIAQVMAALGACRTGPKPLVRSVKDGQSVRLRTASLAAVR